MTTNVKMVDTMSPHISAIAIGLKISLPEKTSGVSPITVVIVLSMIGLNLLSTASMHAASIFFPSSCF